MIPISSVRNFLEAGLRDGPSVATGNIGRALTTAASQAFGAISRTASGMNENVARQVGDYLMSTDPNRIRSIAEMFADAQARAATPSLAPALADAALNAPRQRRREATRAR